MNFGVDNSLFCEVLRSVRCIFGKGDVNGDGGILKEDLKKICNKYFGSGKCEIYVIILVEVIIIWFIILCS